MKIKTQSAEIWKQSPGIDGIYEQIEKAARTCYQSQDLIKEGSAKKITESLIKNGHTAMLEHGTVYLTCRKADEMCDKYQNNKYSIVSFDDINAYITTNYRVIIENDWKKDLKYVCDATDMHTKRYTVHLITNLQVATEFIRHRVMSFAMESTRYCAYDKDKFGDEITFIQPIWLKDKHETIEWVNAMQDCENHYMRLRDKGWSAQYCAQFLPKATKTSLVMTGDETAWEKFFNLRLYEKTGKVHPQAKESAEMIYKEIYGDVVM